MAEAALHFTNRFAALGGAFFTRQQATPFDRPFLIHANHEATGLIGLDPALATTPDYLGWFTGQTALLGSDPMSSVYAGHQFGHYVPQLGDGRALLLGEVVNTKGEPWEIQLKGSGKTPYSRFGDGRAVLRSSIREYLASEALYHLGIPTTRALCLIGSDEPVQRETIEPAAMVTRLAPSFIRFGHFEYFYYRDDRASLRQLADFVIDAYYPECRESDDPYAQFFHAVVIRTAHLIAHWQAYGFAHGVMNTDNMSILGLTIDYGPFGFLDRFDPGFIPNHSDHTGRYAFQEQPSVGMWNLSKLAVALSDLVAVESLEAIIKAYIPALYQHYDRLMQARLGLITWQPKEDGALLVDFLAMLQRSKADYHLSFRRLSTAEDGPERAILAQQLGPDFAGWQARYEARLRADGMWQNDRRDAQMCRVNPCYILRNHLLEGAIRAAYDQQDYREIGRLMQLCRAPFDAQTGSELYASEAPAWAADLCISCSS